MLHSLTRNVFFRVAAVMAVITLFIGPSQFAFANGSNSVATLRREAAELGIHVGSAVSDSVLSSNAQYAQILGQQFSAITPENEMKWASIEAQRGVFTYGPADDEVSFARQHHQLVRGHNLVWHNQLPTWVTSGTFTNAQLADILKQHIISEVRHFRGKIWQWDVVNEPFNEDGTLSSTIWEKALGPNYIADALRWAHEADPFAKLFLNDFNIEGIGPKSNAMFALVKSLKQQHVPIDGVGFETHLDLQFPLPAMQPNMQRFADLGLDVDVTEMDVRFTLPATPALLAMQASWYSQVMQDCIAVRRCVDFTVWEFTDKYSWVPGVFTGEGAADIYDENLAPKPAYTALLNALENPVSHQFHFGGFPPDSF
jgi:endo-1,4-beta-xylanase